jgi:ATP-dependent Clp protease ATP-binding subunit ClpA
MDTEINLTPRAQQVLQLARNEAIRLNYPYVSTEHLLLGLLKIGRGIAYSVIVDRYQLSPITIIEKILPSNKQETKTTGPLPYTPRLKMILALAAKEAKTLNHSYIGTEHLLLGLLKEGESISVLTLRNLGVNIERTRLEIQNEISPNPEKSKPIKTPLNLYSVTMGNHNHLVAGTNPETVANVLKKRRTGSKIGTPVFLARIEPSEAMLRLLKPDNPILGSIKPKSKKKPKSTKKHTKQPPQ